MEYVWVGVGGFAGANTRYIVATWVVRWWPASFPFGTFLINVSGSFLIGILLTLLTERTVVSPHLRLLLVVGFLGGYTTFSSFSYETVALMERDQWGRALAYVIGSNLVSVIACVVGIALVRLSVR